MEKLLKDLGYYSGKIDGILGKKTQHAVKKYQHRFGLVKSGFLDEETKRHMKTPIEAPPLTEKVDAEQKIHFMPNKIYDEWGNDISNLPVATNLTFYPIKEEIPVEKKEIPVDAAWSVFRHWTIEAWAVSTIAYLVLWGVMRKRDGLVLKLHISKHVCGVLSVMIGTATVRMGVLFLFGGHTVMNPEGGLQIVLFLAVPIAVAFAMIKFVMLRSNNVINLHNAYTSIIDDPDQ